MPHFPQYRVSSSRRVYRKWSNVLATRIWQNANVPKEREERVCYPCFADYRQVCAGRRSLSSFCFWLVQFWRAPSAAVQAALPPARPQPRQWRHRPRHQCRPLRQRCHPPQRRCHQGIWQSRPFVCPLAQTPSFLAPHHTQPCVWAAHTSIFTFRTLVGRQ